MEIASPVDALVTAASRAPRLDRAGLISAILVGLIGALVIFITPGFLAIVAQKSGLDDAHLGYIAAWDINSMAVSVGLSTFALSRLSWRWAVATGLALIALGNLATAYAVTFDEIAAARVLAGAGEGIAIGFSFAALGRAANPDRAFAIYLVAGALFSSVFLYALPAIQSAVSPQILFIANAIITVLAALSLLAFPEGRKNEDDVFAQGGRLDLRFAIGALAGVFFYFLAMGAMWSYAERIGSASGLTPTTIAQGLSFGTIAGVLGAALAGMIPQRFGRSVPLALSGIVSVVSFLMLLGHVPPTLFIASIIMLLFGWNFSQPLLSGICSEACAQGRVVCAMGSIQTFGTGLGPAAAAATLSSGSFAIAIWSSSAVLVLSVLIVLLTIRRKPNC
jgi:predicted MFS family arabinose efflux permease